MLYFGRLEGAVKTGDMHRAEIIARRRHQLLFQSPLRAHKQNLYARIFLRHKLRHGDGRVHMARRAAAGKNHPSNLFFHKAPLLGYVPFSAEKGGIRYPAFVGFICRETLSTIPISASWIHSAVPP